MHHTGRISRWTSFALAGALLAGGILLLATDALLRQIGLGRYEALLAWALAAIVALGLSLWVGWLWGRSLERRAQEITQMADLLRQGDLQPQRCLQSPDAIGEAALGLQEAVESLGKRIGTVGRSLEAVAPAAGAPTALRGVARLEDAAERASRRWTQEAQRVETLSGSLAEGLTRIAAELRKQTLSTQFRAAALARLGTLARTFSEKASGKAVAPSQANQTPRDAEHSEAQRENQFFETSEAAEACVRQTKQLQSALEQQEREWQELDALALQARAEAARSGNRVIGEIGSSLNRAGAQAKQRSQAMAGELAKLTDACAKTAGRLQSLPAPGFAAREAARSSSLAERAMDACCRLAARVAEQADHLASDCLGEVNALRELSDLAQSLLVQAALLHRSGVPVAVGQPQVQRIPGTGVTYTVLEGEDSAANS